MTVTVEPKIVSATNASLSTVASSGDAVDLTIDPTGLAVVTETNVQGAIEELDAASGGGGATFNGVLVGDSGSGTAVLTGGNVWNQINWDVEGFDIGGYKAASSSPIITVPTGKAGYYAVSAGVDLTGATVSSTATIAIAVNGSLSFNGLNSMVSSLTLSGDDEQITISSPAISLADGDTVEVQIRHNSATTVTAYPTYGYFGVYKVG